MDWDAKVRTREGLAMVLMAAGALGLALLAGYAVGAKADHEPAVAALPHDGPPPATSSTVIRKYTAVPPPPAQDQGLPLAPQAQDLAAAGVGEIMGGLQLVATADRLEVEPGAEFTLTWKLINHLDRPVLYFDVRPSIVLKKPGFEGGYTAVGESLAPTAEHVKTLAAQSTLTFTRTLEWPKKRRHAAPGWPNYAAPGPCSVRVSFQSENNARVAQQLKTEKGWDVYHERLHSGTLTMNVTAVGENWEDEPKKTTTPQPADEEF